MGATSADGGIANHGSPVPARHGRGRPKGTGKIDHDAVIAAALDALADGGFPALTMRGIARRAGISLATLQHHHPTKDALWRAAVDHLTTDLFERHGSIDPTDLVTRIETFLEQHEARPGLLAVLLSDRAPGSAERLDYLAGRFAISFARADERLDRFEASGLARRVDHRAMLALLTIGIGSIAGAPDAVKTIYGYDLTDDRSRRALAEGLADIIGLGLLRR